MVVLSSMSPANVFLERKIPLTKLGQSLAASRFKEHTLPYIKLGWGKRSITLAHTPKITSSFHLQKRNYW